MYKKIVLMSSIIMLFTGCGSSSSSSKSYSVESFENGDFTITFTIAEDAPAFNIYKILSQRDVTKYDAGDITKYTTFSSDVLKCIKSTEESFTCTTNLGELTLDVSSDLYLTADVTPSTNINVLEYITKNGISSQESDSK